MRYRFTVIFTALFVATLPVAPALAEDHDNRYSITKTDKGFLRLDKKTGNVSLCTTGNTGLTCRMAADERHAYQQEVDAINSRLGALQKRLATLEELASRPSRKRAQKIEEEFDQALKFAERAFRQFFNLVQEMKKEPRKDAI